VIVSTTDGSGNRLFQRGAARRHWLVISVHARTGWIDSAQTQAACPDGHMEEREGERAG